MGINNQPTVILNIIDPTLSLFIRPFIVWFIGIYFRLASFAIVAIWLGGIAAG